MISCSVYCVPLTGIVMVMVPSLCAKSKEPLAVTPSCKPMNFTSIDIDMSADCAFVCVAAVATASSADALPDPPRTTAVLTPPATNNRAAAAMPNMTLRPRWSRLASSGPVPPTVGGAHVPGWPGGAAATGCTGVPSGANDVGANGGGAAGGGAGRRR